MTTAAGAFAQARFQAPFGAPWYAPTASTVAPALGSRFGEPWPVAGTQQPVPAATDRHYTGQRSFEASLGSLYHYQARWYSPVLGRFLSPDPIVPAPGNPQAFNRYSYVYNNPLVYRDPSGYAVVKGYYRPTGSKEIWKGWYDNQETDPYWRGIHQVSTGVGRDIAGGIHVTCSPAPHASECSAWRQQYYTRIKGSSWLMHPAPGQKICIGCEGMTIAVPEDVDLRELINQNLKQVYQDKALVGNSAWELWLLRIRPGGPWDYKKKYKNDKKYRDLGNFNFGVTGKALGVFPEGRLLAGAAIDGLALNVLTWGVNRFKQALGITWEPVEWGEWACCMMDHPHGRRAILAGFRFFEALAVQSP